MEKEIRVLIADGDEDYRVLMSEYLCAGSGMCLAGSAGTADETVELLQSCRADVLLLDLLLPGRDGIYVLEKLRELAAELKYLGVTGEELAALVSEAPEISGQNREKEETP